MSSPTDTAAFGKAIDAIRARIEREVGEDDVAYVKRMRRLSTGLEILGRTLIHVSPEPVSFMTGVGALWLHKQLEATEIGHTALHGAYDGLPGAEAFESETFDWKVPIDEESWRRGHNIKHHQYTNVAGRDPDIDFGPIRLTPQTPHRPVHYLQVPFALLNMTWFGFGMNLHFTGVEHAKTKEERREGWRKAMRKYVPHYAREYGFYPALAGPMFWKVALGNWLAATMRDVYTAATIYCGHIGAEVADYDEGTRAGGRGAWYKMQVESANDFEVPRWISILCGGLDRQIEHHLFPKLAPERLRQIAPEVRAACEAHGVKYNTDTWPRTLGKAFRRLWSLSFPSKGGEAVAAQPQPRGLGVVAEPDRRALAAS